MMRVGPLLELMEELLDSLPVAPDPNCSCHIHPPCGDCVDFTMLRDLRERTEDTINELRTLNLIGSEEVSFTPSTPQTKHSHASHLR